MKSLWKRLVLSAVVIGTGAGMTSSVFAQAANDAGVVRLGKAKAAPKSDVVKSDVVQTSASAQCAPPACAAPACAAPAAISCAPACAAPAATSCAPACAAPSAPSCSVPSAPACAAPCAPSCANPTSCGTAGCSTCGTACSVCDPSCGYSNWGAKWRYRAQCNRMAMRQAFAGSCNTGMCDSGSCNTGMCDSGACYGDGGCKACFGAGRFGHGGFGNGCYGNDCYGNGGFGHGGRGCFGGNGCFGGGHGCFGHGGCNTCGNGNGYGLISYLNCKFGYFCPSGGGGAGVPWAGHYARVYPVNPHYSDPRDGQAYAAQGYGVPISVPLAPVVGHAYDYSWGVPSSRLTPISHPAY